MSAPEPASLLRRLLIVLSILSVLGPARSLLAQQPETIGPLVVDARGAIANYGENDQIAADRNLSASALPSRGLGFTVGAHGYLARLKAVTLGAGAELHLSRGRREPEPSESDGATPTPATMDPVVVTRFTAFSPQLSLNFGHSEGWSYLSGGLGWSTLRVTPRGPGQPTPPESKWAKTINYGGGARWFIRDHLAFSLDIRLYAISPRPASTLDPGSPRLVLLAINAGVSFK